MKRKLGLILFLALMVTTMGTSCPGDEPTAPPESITISGTVTVEGEPLANATVYTSAGSMVSNSSDWYSEVTTDANGHYEVTFDLHPEDPTYEIPQTIGVYVDEHPTPDTEFSSRATSVDVQQARETGSMVVDFDGTYVRTASISGTVSTTDEALEGVSVALSGLSSANTSTGSGGDYEFTGLRAGNYTVTISEYPDEVTFDNTELDVTVGVGEAGTADFTGTRPEPTILITDILDALGDPVDPAAVLGEIFVYVDLENAEGTEFYVDLIPVDDPEAVIERPWVLEFPEAESLVLPVETDAYRVDAETGTWFVPGDETGDGTLHSGLIPNGDYSLRVRLVESSDDEVVSEPEAVTIHNPNQAPVDILLDPAILGNRAEFFGGQDVPFYVTPFIYDGTTVGSIEIQVTPGTQTASGSGTIVLDQTTDDAAPFVFTIPLADNAGGIEDAPGDGPDGAGGAGSDICPVAILDDGGTDITDTFDGQCREDAFFDFDPPDQSGGVTIEGSYPWPFFYMTGDADEDWYVFTLPGVSDDGVGGTYDQPGDLFQIDLYDGGDPPTLLVADVTSTGDLPENPPGGVEMHPTCVRLEDALGNEVPDGEITLTPGDDFGVDLTPPTFLIVDVAGRGDPPVYGDADYEIRLEISDPDLGSELEPAAPGCGVDDEDCASQCRAIDATVLDGPAGAPATLDVRQSPDVLNGDYSGWIGLYNDGDPGNHDPDIFNTTGTYPPTVTLDVTVTITGDGTITITGAPPFVDVTGTFTDGDYFTASGTGTVAGVDNVEVTFDGGITSGFGLFGDVEFGVNGELPDGQSVRYYFEASRISGPDAGPEDFIVVLPSGLPNGTYIIRIDAADQAYYEPNVGSEEFTFVLNRSN